MRNIQTANRVTLRSQPSLAIRPQSQHTSRDDAKPRSAKSDTVRQDATGYNRIQQGATERRCRARTREATAFRWTSLGMEIAPRPQRIGRIRLELPSSSRHTDRSNKPNGTF